MTEDELYSIAANLSESARREFLATACGQDDELLNRILKRLEAEPDSRRDIGAPDMTSVHHSRTPATVVRDSGQIEIGEPSSFVIRQTGSERGETEGASLQPGILIGPYRLSRPLGRGGMGEVWQADQSNPVKRQVAIKLIRAGIGSREILSRFEAERQALALMSHPNIARILDAGSVLPPLPEMKRDAIEQAIVDGASAPRAYWGQPYFVMELVSGIALTTYCDQNKLSINERLRLFSDICSGVQHAHQKGIIHRDLKPGNILVEIQDGKPVPKIIDFGLAKAIESAQQLTEASFLTSIGQILGTLKYMSPEQAGLNGLDIDTRTDIYALGVILYELLTGSTPLDESSIRGQAAIKVLEFIRDKEPVKPSSRLGSSVGEKLSSVTQQRRTDSSQLNRVLTGDLDWIVMKALEKDRTRRYESASGFAADIDRYLRNEPVEARPPSIRYKATKFVRKNKALVVTVCLVFTSLVAGIIGTSWGLNEAISARNDATEARDDEAIQRKFAEKKQIEAEESAAREKAAKEQADARLKQIETINNYVFDIFTDFDVKKIRQTTSEPIEVLLSKRLTEMGEELGEKVITDPLSRANLLNRLGMTLLNLGQTDEANRFLLRARELREKNLGLRHPDTLSSMNNLAAGFRAAGKYDEALDLYEQVLDLRIQSLGAEHPDTLTSMNSLALGLGMTGKIKESISQLEKTLELRKKILGTDDLDTLSTMGNLGTAYLTARQLRKAQPLFEECFRLQAQKLGEAHPDSLVTLGNLAASYEAAADYEKAIPLFEKVHKLQRTKLGENHADTLSSGGNLAFAYVSSGETKKGLKLQQEIVDRQTKVLGADHPTSLKYMHNLAGAYLMDGQLKKAQPLFEKCLAEYKKIFPADHPEIATTMQALGIVYQRTQRLDLALPLLEETLVLQRAKFGDENPQILSTLNSLINGYRTNLEPEKALPLHEDSLRLTKKFAGPSHAVTIASMASLAGAYRDAERLDDALPLFAESVAAIEKDKFRHPNARLIVTNASAAFEKAKQFEPAETWRRKWLEFTSGSKKSNPSAYAGDLAGLALNLMEQQRWVDAETVLRECLELRAEAEPDAWTTFNTRATLGAALFKQGKLDDAESLLVDGCEGMKARLESIPDVGRERYAQAIDRLIEFYEAKQQTELSNKWKAEKEKRQ